MSADYSPIEFLQTMFPREEGQKNRSVTGLIPIDSFNRLEPMLRVSMRAAGLRAMYRGPRKQNFKYPTMTRRQDATGVLIYPK